MFRNLLRKPVFLVVLALLAGWLVFLAITPGHDDDDKLDGRQRRLEDASVSAKGNVVYAAREIKQDDIIAADALEERETLQIKIPFDALTSSSLAVGRMAKRPIAKGQRLSQNDLAPMKDEK